MRELIRAYNNPSGTLDADTIGATYESLTQAFDSLEVLCGWHDDVLTTPCVSDQYCHVCEGLNPMSDAFSAISDQNDDDSRQLSRTISGINGYLDLRRVCPGFEADHTTDPDNGFLNMVIGFTSRGIDPVFGGKLEDCQVRINDVETTLQGDIAFAFGKSFFPDQLASLEPIVRYTGTVTDPEGEKTIDTNLRLSAVQGGDIALAFDVPDVGSMVFVDGLSGRGLHAANGRFACTFDGPTEQPMRCTSLATGQAIP